MTEHNLILSRCQSDFIISGGLMSTQGGGGRELIILSPKLVRKLTVPVVGTRVHMHLENEAKGIFKITLEPRRAFLGPGEEKSLFAE